MTEATQETQETRKMPALMLPMGEKDWKLGHRRDFLASCAPILRKLGWSVGVELKTSDLSENWVVPCCMAISGLGGRICLHPPAGIAKGLGNPAQPIPDNLLLLASQVPHIPAIEAMTIHLAPAQAIEPPEEMGLERYNSPIDAAEMLEHIKRQVDPVRYLNFLTRDKLQIENVDIINFRNGGYRVPTFLALQTGCFRDLAWIAKQAGVRTTFDSEHFLCVQNLLNRRLEYAGVWSPGYFPRNPQATKLHAITGYYLIKDKPPWPVRYKINLSISGYIELIQPRLFHFGAAVRAVDEEGRIATHLPYRDDDKSAEEILKTQLRWILAHPDTLGGVIEVCGQLDPDKYSPWSPRPADDDLAKMQSFLYVIRAIDEVRKE